MQDVLNMRSSCVGVQQGVQWHAATQFADLLRASRKRHKQKSAFPQLHRRYKKRQVACAAVEDDDVTVGWVGASASLASEDSVGQLPLASQPLDEDDDGDAASSQPAPDVDQTSASRNAPQSEAESAYGAQLWAEAQEGKGMQEESSNPQPVRRRKKKRRRAAFVDTMADVEASQNAMLSQTADEADEAADSADQSPSGSFDSSFDSGSPGASVDWDEVTSQVPPIMSAEGMRETKSSTRSFRQLRQSAPLRWFNDAWGRILYNYYLWRKDSFSDLLLIIGVNLAMVAVGGYIKMTIVDELAGTPEGFWSSVYDILSVVFAQKLPEASESLAAQLFGVAAASIGLASFALVLALVEQIVLENIESNVKRGSSVYEKDHVLVLSWAYNRKDLEVMWKLLSQVCLAYRSQGGRVVVVLSSRDKLEMEELFRRTIPETSRYGSTFVFRQGNPLVPDDLRSVAASQAAAICIVSDTSRYPSEADAQSVRAAVLLDELDFPGVGVPDPRVGHIVVELKTANAVPLLRYSCSRRIIGLPTAQLNARRMARIIKSPVVGMLSSFMWSFNSQSQCYLESFPQFVGRTFGSIAFQLPDGLPFGIINHFSGQCQINPPPGTFLHEGDQIIMLRPTSFAKGDYQPAAEPVQLPDSDWDSGSYVCSSWDTSTQDIAATSTPHGSMSPARAMFEGGGVAGDLVTATHYLLPMEYTHFGSGPEKVLICGWGEPTFMSNLLRELDHGPAALPKNSEVVMFNRLETERQQAMLSDFSLRNIRLLHIKGNPLNRRDLDRKIDIQSYKCAVVLCDAEWIDPDLQVSNGIAISDQADLLRLDAMLMAVQLNLRKLLEEVGQPNINIICEKAAFEGVTRFEDGFRLPLGISVNFPAFAASILTEVAFDPKILLPYSHLGETDEMRVQDASCFAERGERVSFWQLQRRAQSVEQVLLGYLEVPATMDQPLNFVINPVGAEARSEEHVWNTGDQHLKLITIASKEDPQAIGRLQSQYVRSAIRETLGSTAGARAGAAAVMQPPLKATTTLTEELLEAAALNVVESMEAAALNAIETNGGESGRAAGGSSDDTAGGGGSSGSSSSGQKDDAAAAGGSNGAGKQRFDTV